MNKDIKANAINKTSKFDKTEEGDNIMLCLSKQTSTQTSASLNSTLFDNMTPSKNDANWDEVASNSSLESDFQAEDP